MWEFLFQDLRKKILTNQQKLISIWEGTITRIWDAIQFCRIIDNLSFWAWNYLKPKVTQYLSQWRLRYCPDVPNIYSLLEMDARTAEIVHQIQDRLSSLGLSPNEDLPALVRQAVVFQEVMRSTTKEAKADSGSKEDMEPPAVPISSPSPPRHSRSRSTGSGQGNDPKINPKEKEILQQDSGVLAGKGERDIAKSSKPQNGQIPQVISSPKPRTPSSVGPDKGKDRIYGSPTVLEDTKGEHSSRILLSCKRDILISFRATSTNVLSNEQTSSFQSLNILEADGRSNNNGSFSNSHQNKTSSAEEGQGPVPRRPKEAEDVTLNLVQRALRSMASRVENGHVLSLAEQKRRKSKLLLKVEKPPNTSKPSGSLPRNGPSKESSTDRTPSSSPGPFVSETFSLSFQPMPWLDLDMAGPGIVTRHRHGPYPTLRIGIVEYDEYPWETDHISVLLRRMRLARKPVVEESPPPPPRPPLTPPPPPASPLKVKIPWKNKYIMVKLPPVDPTLSSIERKSDPSGQGQRWKV